MPYTKKFDRQSDTKLSNLLHTLQLTAESHLESLNITYDFLRAHNMVFVLTALRLETVSPYSGQPLTVTTYPKSTRGILFLRDFELYLPDATRFGQMATEWALMDFASRTLLRPGALPVEIPQDPSPLDHGFPARRLNLPADLQPTGKITVSPCHLDRNLHVNNAIYADFVSSVIDFPIRTLEIHYVAEARLGDEIALSSDGHFVRGTVGEKVCFSAYVE